ncbi:trans-aconitate 2-methyltransferase [compost metagenome]|jgi:ubiquinone/menaquinone biosynthesis C-methylase UbiE
MAQYQSFPNAPGDSRSLDKLKALRLPSLQGKRFLDVGCNEGFFCGFAFFSGAERVVGIDRSPLFIERARQRFPRCDFHQSGWDALPEGLFDVILLASALHYADDQPALIDLLMSKLAPDGVLILEIGIAHSMSSEWVKVARGIDQRFFPSMPKVHEVLAEYAWKWMGPSVSQDGDPVDRHVLQVSHHRPLCYLLMKPPAYGKSTISRDLFVPAGIPVISGDDVLSRIAEKKIEVSGRLVTVVSDGFSPFHLDAALRSVFEQGLGGELLEVCANCAGGGSFALDMYVPDAQHAFVRGCLYGHGFLPVELDWERPALASLSEEESTLVAESFYMSLVNGASADSGEMSRTSWDGHACGFIDEIDYRLGMLTLRGWAVDTTGQLPAIIEVAVGEQRNSVSRFERQLRQDVQVALRAPHALLGYCIELPMAGLNARYVAENLQVVAQHIGKFEASSAIQRLLEKGA